MSSTTSSDCENCDCSQCTYSFENNHNDYGKLLLNSRHLPMYATMAHPLIYYAEIQQPLNRRETCDQSRKDNPFKKAFKWYTQERTLCNKNCVTPENSGFANWLDNKYVEYLRESGQQTKAPTSHEPRVPESSTAESCPCPPPIKKFGRFKSPWKKRRRLGNDSGDVPEKFVNRRPDGSCEFLLKPKELTRAASEPSYHTPTSGGKSNSTVASSNMQCNTKCSGRSHSLSDVTREKSAPKHGDTVPHAVQACPNCQEQAPTKLATTSCVCHQEQVRSKEQALCKCPKKKVPKIEQVSTKERTNQPKPLQGTVPKVPSKEQCPTNQEQHSPCCKYRQEKVPEIEQVPTKQHPTNQPKPLQEEVPKVVKVLSKEQALTNQPKPLQEEVPEVVKVLSKELDPTNQPKPLQVTVPKVPSKAQCPANQLELCCKCNLEKVVQVPSQSRAVEESCQYPDEKLFLVHEETQYEPAPRCSTQNLEPCTCKTCKKPTPPLPPMYCIPFKVQSNQIASPEMCLTIAPAQNDAPKKQKAKPLNVSCRNGEGNKSKVDTQSQHQPEMPACCKDTAASPVQSKEITSPEMCLTIPSAQNDASQKQKVTQLSLSCQSREGNKSKVDTQSQHQPELSACCRDTAAAGPVQSNQFASPEMCLTIAPAQNDAPQKQKVTQLSVSCRSGEGNTSKVDNRSQHQPELSACCRDTAAGAGPNTSLEVSQVFGPIPIRRQSYSTVNVNEQTGEYSIVKEVVVVNKFTRSVTCASNDAAQTSDHSIRFDREPDCCQYPLFFKIICADISKNE